MKDIKLLAILLCLTIKVYSQSSGIVFRNFDNWEAVIKTANIEKKPVFVDFYTTWCAPCKMMERDVFTDREVALFFNTNFICIKVQMDRNRNDNSHIKNWYKEIHPLEIEYNINGYPTYLYLSSEGKIVNRVSGYLNAKDLIKTGSEALQPGFKYIDKSKKYYNLLLNANGNELEIIKSVNKLVFDDDNFFDEKSTLIDTLNKYAFDFLKKNPSTILSNKEAIKLVGRNIISVEDSLFKVIYANQKEIDRLIGIENFSRLIIDRSIRKKYFTNTHNNLDSIAILIQDKYGIGYATSAIELQKVLLSYSPKSSETFINEYLNISEKYGVFYSQLILQELKLFSLSGQDDLQKLSCLAIDLFCERYLFPLSSDEKQLKRGINLLQPVVEDAFLKNFWWLSDCAETFAHLHYAVGNRSLAIEYQKKALEFSKLRKDPIELIEFYKNGLHEMLTATFSWPIRRKQ